MLRRRSLLTSSTKPRLQNGLYFEDTNGVVYYYGTPSSYSYSSLASKLTNAGITDPVNETCLVIITDDFCARVSAPTYMRTYNRARYSDYSLSVYRNMKSGYEVRDLVKYSNPDIGKDYYVVDFCYTYTFPSGAGDGYLPCYEEVFYLLNTCRYAIGSAWGNLYDTSIFPSNGIFPTVSYYDRNDNRTAKAYNCSTSSQDSYYVSNDTSMLFHVFGLYDPTKYTDVVY